MKKLTLLAAAAALLLGACASGPTLTETDAMSAISAAERETSLVKKVNYEWRDTGKLIKKAKEAAKKQDFETAVKLANKAKRQSTNALLQYESQKNAGPRYN